MKTILILDDDPAVTGFMRSVLLSKGYSVLQATTPDEALRRFEENDARVDLLVADVTLRAGSGVHVALDMQGLVPYLPIIIMSGYPPSAWNGEDVAECEQLDPGSVAIIQKPFSPSRLLEQVHERIGPPVKAAPAAG